MAARPTDRRPRRFVLPDHGDERAGEKIEEFLSGPGPRHDRVADGDRSRAGAEDPLIALDTRVSWNDALRREGARLARYGRPAAVVIVDLDAHREPGAGYSAAEICRRLARPVAHVLRREARETDRIARVSDNRFHILLPETTDRDARHYADRVRLACELWLEATDLPGLIRISLASASRESDLLDALATAERRLEGPSAQSA
jgi:diguanylate cyclase (GGDEF)-like protein